MEKFRNEISPKHQLYECLCLCEMRNLDEFAMIEITGLLVFPFNPR